MTSGTLEIHIDENITEQMLVEQCLNMVCSGYEPEFFLFLYAMKKHWNFDNLVYYYNMIQEVKKENDNNN